jgi:hypothetical protein
MVNHQLFGRRGGPQHPPGHARGVREAGIQHTRVESTERSLERPMLMSETTDFPSVDDELWQWKQARKQNLVPWRSLSLVATLCFGMASFVLPDSVNDNIDWLLYTLAAASLYIEFRKRRR